MAKAVFTTKVDPTYDDLPEQRYHFPRTYLRAVEAVVGDWIVYYEPRRSSGDVMSRGGRQAYFATARVTHLEPDPVKNDHFYAFVADYLEFDHAVPFKDGEMYYESALRKPDGSTSKGAFGRAVRPVPEMEYDLILQAGFANILDGPARKSDVAEGFGESDPYRYEIDRRKLVTQVSRRPFRDRAFSVAIKTAYDDTCAMTGLKIINGGGRSEVQAAHIMPVAEDGPDSVRNGVALCGTLHWMFDRGLVSIDDDYSLLVAESSVPDTVGRLINANGKLTVPTRPQVRPHRIFLKFHRETIFKG